MYDTLIIYNVVEKTEYNICSLNRFILLFNIFIQKYLLLFVVHVCFRIFKYLYYKVINIYKLSKLIHTANLFLSKKRNISLHRHFVCKKKIITENIIDLHP